MKTINLKKITIATAAAIGLGTAAIATTNYFNQPTTVQAASSKIKLSQNAAVKKFKAKFKKAKVESISLDKENGRYVYEIEGFDSNNDYSVDINAETGAVSHVHSEKLDRDDRNQKALDLSGVISRDEANRIAQEHAKGTSEEWKLERDDTSGKTYWEVKVKNGHQETEIKIDAHSKAVVSTEHDD